MAFSVTVHCLRNSTRAPVCHLQQSEPPLPWSVPLYHLQQCDSILVYPTNTTSPCDPSDPLHHQSTTSTGAHRRLTPPVQLPQPPGCHLVSPTQLAPLRHPQQGGGPHARHDGHHGRGHQPGQQAAVPLGVVGAHAGPAVAGPNVSCMARFGRSARAASQYQCRRVLHTATGTGRCNTVSQGCSACCRVGLLPATYGAHSALCPFWLVINTASVHLGPPPARCASSFACSPSMRMHAPYHVAPDEVVPPGDGCHDGPQQQQRHARTLRLWMMAYCRTGSGRPGGHVAHTRRACHRHGPGCRLCPRTPRRIFVLAVAPTPELT